MRNLVRRQTVTAKLRQLLLADSAVRLQGHTGHDRFAPLGIGYSEYGRFQHRRMFVEYGLDFAAEYLFAASNNHVFNAIDKIEVAGRILIAEVPRAKEAILKGPGGILRVLPIARHYVCSPGRDFTTLSRRKTPACLVHHLQINAGTWPATRHEPLRRMLLVPQPRQEPGLAPTETRPQRGGGKNPTGAANAPRSDGRAAISQNFQAPQIITAEVSKLRQEVNHRRHHDRVGNLLIGDDFAESLGIEPWQCNLAGAKRRRGEHRRKIGDMKDGGDMKINAALTVTHPIIEVMHV